MAKVGRPKNIDTPEVMKEHFFKYKSELKGNPFLVKDWVGKDSEQVYREKEKPLTMEGFENYLFINDIITDVSDYFENKDNRYAEFVPICRVIRRIIRQDQIEGGMANVYNSSVTQRLNNLVEKVDATTNGEKINNTITIDYGKLSDATLREIDDAAGN